jgi:hypothetical protein
MSPIIRTHNAYHLGDNLVHLHFLRKVALANPDRQFIHYAQNQYARQLRPVIADIPNIKLDDFGYMLPSDSINAWRGDRRFWYESPIRNDFVRFHFESWFPYLCDRMEVENPMHSCPRDMLFDYPAIRHPINGSFPLPFDILVVNAPPGSGQFQEYDASKMSSVIDRLVKKGWAIFTTGTGIPHPFFSATEIGSLSLHCHTILMVSTGPSWPTFNVWNQDSVKNRIILLDNERVNLAPNTMHCSRIEEAEEVLKGAGLL